MTVRVRYAPSPTGHLHIGGVRSALFNYLFARHFGGDFILRLEDTDLERNVPGAEEEILKGFRWLGFDWAEGPDVGGQYGPYRCTERLPVYQEYLADLLSKQLAYPCYCTTAELEANRENAQNNGKMVGYSGRCRHLSLAERQAHEAAGRVPNYRFATPTGVELAFDDLVRGPVTFTSDDVSDFVIVKSNGIPTYNFQVVIDDALMKITHVIRGEEHLSNTPRQLLIYRAFGFKPPIFAHLPQVLDQSRKKLSKRDPNVMPVHKYREQGYLPEAIVNFLALLGWSPVGEQEMLNIEELIRTFGLDRVNKSGAIFDVDKLRWMANQYFKRLPKHEAGALVANLLQAHGWAVPQVHLSTPDWLENVVALYQEQMSAADDFFQLAGTFFSERLDSLTMTPDVQEILQESTANSVLSRYLELVKEDEEWTADASRRRFKQVQTELGIKGKSLFMPIRAAVTGAVHGPDLQLTMSLLPKAWVMDRLQAAIQM